MVVTVTPARRSEAGTLARLMELYLHDFSELGGPAIGENGLFGYPYLEEYWTESGRFPLLIRVDEHLAGFVLVAEQRLFDPDGTGHEITEFFVLRSYRRRGVGRAAAVQTLRAFTGPWRVGELAENGPAIAFWRAVITDLTAGQYVESTWEREGQRGVFQTFVDVQHEGRDESCRPGQGRLDASV